MGVKIEPSNSPGTPIGKMAALRTSYTHYSISWFLEPAKPGALPRYRGRGMSSNEAMVYVPEHQRDYVWKLEKQRNLIRSVFNGYPIPSIMVTQDEKNRYSLQDGQQRLETFFLFYTNRFAYDQTFFKDMTDAQKKVFLNYVIPIVDTTGATLEQETEIYDLLNQGVALSHGEKFWNRRMKPLVRLTEELFMKVGEGLTPLATSVWGEYLAGCDNRHARLANAIAYVAGAAYGPEYISTSYGKLAGVLDRLTLGDGTTVEIDATRVRRRLETLLDIYRLADNIQVCANATKKKMQWKIGLYSAYILYSILETEDDPETFEYIKEAWVEFLRNVRVNPSVEGLLYKGMANSNNITLERMRKGYVNLLEMAENGYDVETTTASHSDEEED